MPSPRVRTTAALIATAGVLFALTACAPATSPHHTGGSHHPSAGATTTPTPTPTPTPTVSTLDTTAPTPLGNVSCSNLVTSADLSGAFPGAAVTQIPTPSIAAGDLAGTDTQIPADDYVRAAGGVFCLWTNTPANHYVTSFPQNRKTVEISFLFNAGGAPWTNSQIVDSSSPSDDMNDGSCDIGSCELDELVNGKTWVSSLELNQNPSGDHFENIIDADKAAAASIAAQPLPAPAAGTLALGHTCTALVDDSSVTQALGVPVVSSQPLKQQDYLDFYGTWEGAQDELGDHPCVWKNGATTVGHLSWLPAGAWAWDEAQTQTLADGTPTPLAVPGLADGDTAFIRCSASDVSCVVDLIIGGDWIEAQVSRPGSTNRAAVTAIATAIVAKLG